MKLKKDESENTTESLWPLPLLLVGFVAAIILALTVLSFGGLGR